jgi:hypothetical protein
MEAQHSHRTSHHFVEALICLLPKASSVCMWKCPTRRVAQQLAALTMLQGHGQRWQITWEPSTGLREIEELNLRSRCGFATGDAARGNKSE